MFKVNNKKNKNTRTMSLTSPWCFYWKLWIYLTPFFSVSIVKFAQTNISWVVFQTAQKMKIFIKDSFSKCDQIRSFLQIRSHLLKKFLKENLISCPMLREIGIFWLILTFYPITPDVHKILQQAPELQLY